jgi:hypothetical protein
VLWVWVCCVLEVWVCVHDVEEKKKVNLCIWKWNVCWNFLHKVCSKVCVFLSINQVSVCLNEDVCISVRSWHKCVKQGEICVKFVCYTVCVCVCVWGVDISVWNKVKFVWNLCAIRCVCVCVWGVDISVWNKVKFVWNLCAIRCVCARANVYYVLHIRLKSIFRWRHI